MVTGMQLAETTFYPDINPRISNDLWDVSPGSQTQTLWNFSFYSSLKSLLSHHPPSLSVIFWLHSPLGHFPQEQSHQRPRCLVVLPNLPSTSPTQEKSNQLLSLPRYQLCMEIFCLPTVNNLELKLFHSSGTHYPTSYFILRRWFHLFFTEDTEVTS